MIKLEEINPFIRLVHVFGYQSSLYREFAVAVDNRCFFVRAGAIEIGFVEGSLRITSRQMVLIPAGYPYKFISLSADAEVLGINFDYTRVAAHKKTQITPILLDRFTPEALAEGKCQIDQAALQSVLYLSNAARFSEIMESIEIEFKSGRVLSDAALSAKMKQFIVEVVDLKNSGGFSAETVKELLLYIRLHCTERISNEEIGQALRFHPNYLNRLIRQHTGKSLHAYLVHCRVLHAINLLQTTSLTIEEIAIASGFGDPQQFSKAFRREMGYTPSAFRKVI